MQLKQLRMETFNKNMIDKDEYPQTAEIEKRRINIIARLLRISERYQHKGGYPLLDNRLCLKRH